jgi:hypothetical protein
MKKLNFVLAALLVSGTAFAKVNTAGIEAVLKSEVARYQAAEKTKQALETVCHAVGSVETATMMATFAGVDVLDVLSMTPAEHKSFAAVLHAKSTICQADIGQDDEEEFTCPKVVSCMPPLAPGGNKYCSSKFKTWAKEHNCNPSISY